MVDIKVAIKVIHDQKETSEVRSLSALHHPNITELYEYIGTSELKAIVMEFVDGEELYARLERGRLCESEAKFLFYQLCLAVDHCHRNQIAHRDVKLENILVTKSNQVKLCDFGLAAEISDSLMDDYCGSVCYTAPEILKFIPYDGRKSDIWSLGIVLFSMLTGHLPFAMDSSEVSESKDRSTRLRILEGVYHIPSYIQGDSKELIRRALAPVTTRIVMSEILQHSWFQDVSISIDIDYDGSKYCIQRLIEAGLSIEKLKEVQSEQPDKLHGLLKHLNKIYQT